MLNIQFLRRHNKRILAFLGIFLMIAFIVPTGLNRQRDARMGEHGSVFGMPITSVDIRNAEVELDMLQRQMAVPFLGGDMGYIEFSLFRRLYMVVGLDEALLRARRIAAAMTPLDFTLLLREARQANIALSAESAEIRQEVESLAPGQNLPEDVLRWRAQAVADWLSIMAVFDRHTATVQVTPARATWLLARSEQEIQLRLLEYRARDFVEKLPRPTEEQLEAFFASRQKIDPTTAPDGIGYVLPNRVSLEYIRISKEHVRRSVTADESADFWLRNPSRFQTMVADTQPAEGATTQPTSRPTTRPWTAGNEVDQEIRDGLADQRCAALARVATQYLTEDWPAFREAARMENKDIPANPPRTTLGPDYASFAFMRAVAQRTQMSREGREVDPAGIQYFERDALLTAQQLRDLTDIGKASFGGGLDVPRYVTTMAAAFMDEKDRRAAESAGIPPLHVLEPARLPVPARDPEGNVYIFRISRLEASRPAKDLDEVRGQVLEDWRLTQALALAREQAEKLVAAAREKNLREAAGAAGLGDRVIETEMFKWRRDAKLEKFPVAQENLEAFMEGAFGLLQTRLKTGREHPVALVELPRARSVVVAELADARPADPAALDTRAGQLARSILMETRAALLPGWFEREAIRERTGYKEPGAP